MDAIHLSRPDTLQPPESPIDSRASGGSGDIFSFEPDLKASKVYRRIQPGGSNVCLDEYTPLSRPEAVKSAIVSPSLFSRIESIMTASNYKRGQSAAVEDDRATFTVPDSGYGTASKAATSAVYRPPAKENTDLDDLASVITDNLSLNLPQGVGNAYVKEFVDQILRVTSSITSQESEFAQLTHMLPDLLRTFALRVSFAERSAQGDAVGLFTRKNRE